MVYSTYFEGQFDLNKKLDDNTYELIKKLANTRRMKRDMKKLFPEVNDDVLLDKYGVDGKFFTDGPGFLGQDKDVSVIDQNRPPRTQPGLWLQWIPSEDRKHIEWNGGEKFYEYVEWLKYLVDRILAPKGYVLNGKCYWYGEEESDKGIIEVRSNEIYLRCGTIVYGEATLFNE